MSTEGDTVVVYEDPIACALPEGKATLVGTMLQSDPVMGEYWTVHFIGDPPAVTYPRWVRPTAPRRED